MHHKIYSSQYMLSLQIRWRPLSVTPRSQPFSISSKSMCGS